MQQGLLKMIGLAAAAELLSLAVVAAPSPNMVFVLTDDQGWADLNTPMDPAVPEGSCAYFHTPNLDRLAREGMRFPSGYASSPICTPTRRSIQFGMTPARQRGTEFVSDAFTPKGHLSIPQALKRANPRYRCAHFGKWGETISGPWHRSDQQDPNMEASPERLGYDESDGLTGNTTGTQHAITEPLGGRKKDITLMADPDPKRTFSVTARAVSFMERSVAEKRPFYLQVSYYAIHLALQAKADTIAKYADRGRPPRQVIAGVAPMLEDLDTGIGQLLAAMDRLGLRDNTYVFFSSDNGGSPEMTVAPASRKLPERNHPLQKSKQWLYEGGIRVPFIVRGPGVQAGSVCREPVVQYDLLPTFYALAGGREPLPADIDGGDLSPLFAQAGKGSVKRSMSGLVFHRPGLRAQPHSALRVGDFKLVITWSGPWQVARRELFNLADDIGEKTNLAETMSGKADEMSAALIAYLKSVNAETPIPAAPRKKSSPTTKP
jgi:arylsulfatase A-like enzyme